MFNNYSNFLEGVKYYLNSIKEQEEEQKFLKDKFFNRLEKLLFFKKLDKEPISTRYEKDYSKYDPYFNPVIATQEDLEAWINKVLNLFKYSSLYSNLDVFLLKQHITRQTELIKHLDIQIEKDNFSVIKDIVQEHSLELVKKRCNW